MAQSVSPFSVQNQDYITLKITLTGVIWRVTIISWQEDLVYFICALYVDCLFDFDAFDLPHSHEAPHLSHTSEPVTYQQTQILVVVIYKPQRPITPEIFTRDRITYNKPGTVTLHFDSSLFPIGLFIAHSQFVGQIRSNDRNYTFNNNKNTSNNHECGTMMWSIKNICIKLM